MSFENVTPILGRLGVEQLLANLIQQRDQLTTAINALESYHSGHYKRRGRPPLTPRFDAPPVLPSYVKHMHEHLTKKVSRTMSPAGRARLSRIAKARWRKAKAKGHHTLQ